MHLSYFKTFICFMFYLFAFEAKFSLHQLFLAEIETQYSEFLSWRDWWHEMSRMYKYSFLHYLSWKADWNDCYKHAHFCYEHALQVSLT